MVVKWELEKLDIHINKIEMEEVDTMENISQEKLLLLEKNFKQIGLELIDKIKDILVEKVKTVIIEWVRHSDEIVKINLSHYLSEKLGHNYTYLANVFSEVNGSSIEQFYISQKIERVKELLEYNKLTLKEISFKTQYSSIAHLSHQFKKITGLSPTQYKELQNKNRVSLSQIAC
jgi:YesN/AraC family two-component response regulator